MKAIVCFSLTVLTSATLFAADDADFRFRILAKTAGSDLQSIDREVSVNNGGVVSFLGTAAGSSPLKTLYAGRSDAGGMSALGSGNLGAGVHINDRNEILTRRVEEDRFSGQTITYTYLDRWDLNTGLRLNVLYTHPPVPGLPNTWLDVIRPYALQNNNGTSAFIGMSGGGFYLSTLVAGQGNRLGPVSDCPPYMMPADNNLAVLRLGPSGAYYIDIRRLPDFARPYGIGPGKAGGGFDYVGFHPEIDDEGRIVVFYGNLTAPADLAAGMNPGPGVFAYLVQERKLFRLAGVHGNGYLDPGESFDDLNGNGQFDRGQDQDEGLFNSFAYDEAACVNNQGTVIFLATDKTGKKSLYRTYLKLQTTPQTVGSLIKILSVGDTVEGLPGTVEDIALYDSLNNAGKYGDAVFWVSCGGVQAVVKATENSCAACQCDPGDVNCQVDSLNVKIGLGRTATSSHAAYLGIKAETPRADLATPAGLAFSGDAAMSRVYATNAFSGSNVLRQVKGVGLLADIAADSPYRYTLRVYNAYGARDTNTGVYPPVGSPNSTIVVENPDGAASTNRLRITRNGAEVNLFTFTPANGEWELLSGVANALRKESLLNVTNGVVRTETRTVRDAANVLLSQTVSTYQTYAWGEELVQSVTGPSGMAKTTTYTYYTNQATDGGNYARRRSVLYPEGRWEFYRAYSGETPSRWVAQFQNNSYTESAGWPDPSNRCYEVAYVLGLETHVEYLQGQLVSKRWRKTVSASETWDSVATAPSATGWNDPANLITRSFTYTTTDTNGASVGQTAKVINPDGTMSQYFYYTEFINDPFYSGTNTPPKTEITRTVTFSGQPNTNLTAVIDGTRSEQVVDALGNSLWRRDYDLASGALTASETTTTRDWLGRATRIDYLGGTYVTRSYDCCGLALETDREGVTTTYSTGGSVQLDITHTGTPQTYAGSSVTRAGLTTYTLTDAMGRAMHTVLQGTNGALIIQEQRGYDNQGNLAWSRDAMNRLTSYTNTTDGPFRVATTTFPDGSQSIESTYQDGSAYETKGNAVQGLRYTYDVRQDNGVWVQTTTQTRLESDGSLSPEYTTTYTDFAGRAYQTEYPWPDGPGPVFATRTYNVQGQLVQSTDPDGLTTLYAYNGRGELETTALDLANPGVIDFAGTDRITRTTSSVENSALRGTVVRKTVTELCETNGVSQSTVLQTSETSADGTQTWTTQYGLTTHTTNALDRANQRRTVTTENPDGTRTVSVSEQGRQKSVTQLDKNGARVGQTTLAYDPFGRLQTQTDARSGPTTYTYYDDGQLHTVTTPDPDPGASGPGLDPQTTSYTYDRDPANGLKTVTTLPDGGVVTQEYFPTGQPKKTWGARTYPAEYTYDRAGRMATLTTWQQFNFATGTGIAGSATTRWNYNARGLLANKRYADNKGPGYTYTAGGKLKTRLWARGVLTTYGYDDKTGDLLTTTYSDATPAVTNTYARSGQLQSVLDTSGLRTFGYRHGQTATEAYGPGLFAGFTLVRDYDDLDRQAALSVTSPTGAVYHVTYGYDAASRLNTVVSGPDVATYTYHPASGLVDTLIQSHSNAVRLTTTKLYDKLGRLQSITSVPSADSPISFAYQYNDANQRTRATLANGEYWTYGYDPLGQVTNGVKRFPNGAPIPGYSFGYGFDAIGNRQSAMRDGKTDTYTNNALNQIAGINQAPWLHVIGVVSNNATITVNGQTPIRSNGYFYAQLAATNAWNTVSVQARAAGQAGNGTDALAEETGHLFYSTNPSNFRYDEDGNIKSDTRWAYFWNAENQLVSMRSLTNLHPPSPYAPEFRYGYDSFGRRIKATSYGVGDPYQSTLRQSETTFFYDGWTVLTAREANGFSAQSFLWGNDVSDTPREAAGVGGLLLNQGDGPNVTANLEIYDGDGNVASSVVAATGQHSSHSQYGPFGECLRVATQSHSLSPFAYSTKYNDEASGLLYYGFRYYNPLFGTWQSRDLVDEGGGLNLYAFLSSAPVGRIDLLGLAAFSCCAETINIANIQSIDTESQFGHSFDLTIGLLYLKSEDKLSRDCQLIWNESIDNPAVSGHTANQKTDMFALHPTSPTFKPWQNRRIDMGSALVTINDTPLLSWRKHYGELTTKRKLKFEITVKSGSDCRCKKAHVTATAEQTLEKSVWWLWLKPTVQSFQTP